MCLSSIIGSTVFVITGLPIAFAGLLSILAYVIVGAIVLIIASEFGELDSLFPYERGAAYSFAYNAFGSELGFITGILLYFAYCTSVSVIAVGFGAYVAAILGLGSSVLNSLFAIVLIGIAAFVNRHGIKHISSLSSFLVLLTLAVLAVFLGYAVLHGLNTGAQIFGNLAMNSAQFDIGNFFSAVVVVVFAYTGFQSVTTISSEISGTRDNAVKVMRSGIFAAIIIYILVSTGLILLMPAHRFGISSNPFFDVLKFAHVPYWMFLVVGLGAITAIIAASITILFTASNLLYQISLDGLIPKFAREYDRKAGVATNGVWISAAIAAVMLFSGNIYLITAISNFGVLFSWLMASFALIIFRKRGATPFYKAPFYPYLPAIGIGASLLLMASLPRESLSFGVIIIILMLITYYSMVLFKSKTRKVRLFD